MPPAKFFREIIAIYAEIRYTYGMDTQIAPQSTPARFRFRFSPLMIVLCTLGLALCSASFGLTTWRFVLFLQQDPSSIYGWMRYVLLYAASIALTVLIVAMLIRSEYKVTPTHLSLRFGLIVQKFEIGSILSVHLFRGAGKLAVYFDDLKTDFLNIVIRPESYDTFIRTLQAQNDRIAFTFSTAEEEAEVKKKKK